MSTEPFVPGARRQQSTDRSLGVRRFDTWPVSGRNALDFSKQRDALTFVKAPQTAFIEKAARDGPWAACWATGCRREDGRKVLQLQPDPNVLDGSSDDRVSSATERTSRKELRVTQCSTARLTGCILRLENSLGPFVAGELDGDAQPHSQERRQGALLKGAGCTLQ
jgi:hypothetical protein